LDKADSAANLLDACGQAPKGIVDPQAAAHRIRLATYLPAAALAPFVEYCWVVEWDRRGCAPETQRVLPKWVIQHYRRQEAIWRLAQPDAPDLASLAHALGFFEQAHFSRSFAELVGSTPLDYRCS
jgi:hypothetical protein